MTVSTIGSVAEFDTNGVTTNYPFFFKFLANEDLVVTYVDPLGVSSILTFGTHYTANGAGSENGGSIVTTAALAGPGQLIVSREMQAFQQTSLRNQGKFLAETHEDVFDKLTMLVQQGFAIFKRALTRPFGRDYFFAENRRITAVKDPVDAQDAATKLWAQTYVGAVVAGMTGNPNLASNVFYLGPDGVPRVVQDMSGPGGLGLIGYDATLNYPANSAGSALKGVVASANSAAAVAAEASRLATTGTFGNAQMLTRIRARISNAPTMYVLGDSISHGAFAGNIYRHSWVNLFRRMIYNEVGTLSYGFTPTLALFDPLGVAQKEIHDIDLLGTWVVRESETGSHVAQGVSFVSNGTGNSIKSTVPTFQDSCTVYYVSRPGGGTFDIKVNGVTVTSVNTTSASIDPIVGVSLPMKDNRSGICIIEVVTTSTATVEVCGFSYGGAYSDSILHNFSTSGRRLRWLDENTISRMMQGTSLFIMALGINDLSQNESDPSYFSEFVTRISWLIQYANQYKVPMVVPDFVWSYPSTNKTRQQLKRLADETQGIYIPFPDYFRKGSQSADASYLINDLKLFTDEAHPNVDGHKYIAETIAKKLGLGVTSKKEALDFHDWWFPLYLGSSAIKNLDFGTEPPSRLTSATKNDGSCVLLRLNLDGVTGTSPVQLSGGYSPSSGVFIDLPVTGQLQPENNGASAGLVSVSATGVVVSPNSTNTRPNHKVLVVVPRGERPFVNGVIY